MATRAPSRPTERTALCRRPRNAARAALAAGEAAVVRWLPPANRSRPDWCSPWSQSPRPGPLKGGQRDRQHSRVGRLRNVSVKYENVSLLGRPRRSAPNGDWTYHQKIEGHYGLSFQGNEHVLSDWVHRVFLCWVRKATFAASHLLILPLQVNWEDKRRAVPCT